MPILVLACMLAACVYGGYYNRAAERHFAETCAEKGGVALRGIRPTGGWIGCYDVNEIYNEEE